MGEKIFKFLIDKLVLNEKWTSLGKYMIPKMLIISNNLDKKFGGYCSYKPFSCTITVRPKYEDDEGLIEHEKTHARQYGRLLWLHSLLSWCSGWYRLLVEIEAYRSQVKHYNYTATHHYEWIINSIHEKYNLGISKEKIRMYVDYAFRDLIKDTK